MSFILKSLLLGVGLAMDAFSVSLANGLHEPSIKKRRMAFIAAVFAFFQALMPLLGWFCVHNIAKTFSVLQPVIPWIALSLLLWIGGHMLYDGIKGGEEEAPAVGFAMLLTQGVATSIDALSVGFTIAEYNALMALFCALIIAAVTFVICFAGCAMGCTAGTKLAGKASILGGIILIAIGLEIFLTGVL